MLDLPLNSLHATFFNNVSTGDRAWCKLKIIAFKIAFKIIDEKRQQNNWMLLLNGSFSRFFAFASVK